MNIAWQTQSKLKQSIGRPLLALTAGASLLLPIALVQARDAKPTGLGEDVAEQLPQQLKDQIFRKGAGAAAISAKTFNLKTINGMRVLSAQGLLREHGAQGLNTQSTPPPLTSSPNVGIGATSSDENEPIIASNPVNKKRVVAASHQFNPGFGVVVYTSADSGKTWSAGFPMPLLHPGGFQSDPVLAYAPNGSRVYCSYVDIRSEFVFVDSNTFQIIQDFDIVVNYSDDDGASWIGPIVALDGLESTITVGSCPFSFSITPANSFAYDKPWIATHVDMNQSQWVYVTATRFDNDFPDSHIAFASSSDKGVSWNPPTILDTETGADVVQGSRPSGGLGGEVLVAWYDSAGDGFLNGAFKIRTARSSNHGATWDPVIDAVTDNYEVPAFLGPFNDYHRWFGVMFPSVEIGADGSAHIAYTHSPVPSDFPGFSFGAENGDIRYITSPTPPYASWSVPVTVSDDGSGMAQGYAAIKVQGEQVNLIWEDHRQSPSRIPNILYDIYYSSSNSKQNRWSKNQRVTDVSSLSDFVFIGDYIGLTVIPDGTKVIPYGIWTDRRTKNAILDPEDNVFGAPIK